MSDPIPLHLEVPQDPPTTRLDAWLAEQTPLSRARIQKLISQGQVRVNGLGCKPRDALRAGDRIEIVIPPNQVLELDAQPLPLEIIYEDGELLVINKPQGLVVHPAPGHSDHTLVNALLAHCRDLSGINGVERPGIVHRLDKDTSGLLMVAKTDHAHHHLQQQIQNKTARRDYLAIVYGAPGAPEGVIDAPIGRHPVHRQKMAVVERGRAARTHWRIAERLGNFTLMEFSLETGRTHQIRVHCLFMGHPIVGDPLYSSAKSPVRLDGQALHAYCLSFDHPVSSERLSFEAPLPPPMAKLLRVLHSK